MEGKVLEKAIGHYDYYRRLYYDFCNVVQDLFRRLLDRKKLTYNNISGRVKTRKSYIEKCKKEKYSQWSDIYDLLGVRVITYLLKDVEAICKLIEMEVCVVEVVDKADELNNNEFGYMARHYILRLNDERASLPEYSKYKNLYFEVQVKTLAQHAWATITHDRLYKTKHDELPNELARRFTRMAGILEEIDESFQALCNDYEDYADEVTAKIRKGILNIEINSASLVRYCRHKFTHSNIHIDFGGKDAAIINELMKYGIATLEDLDKIIPNDINPKIGEIEKFGANLTTLLRQIMIINNEKLFFEKSWGGDWISARSLSKNALLKSYSINIESLMKYYKNQIDNELTSQIARSDLDMEINVITLIRYSMQKFNTEKIGMYLEGKNVNIFDELNKFGVSNLRDLDSIIPDDIVCRINEAIKYSTNITKLLRHIMIIHDADRYFLSCWSGSWPDLKGAMGNLCRAYGLDVSELKQRYYHLNS